MSLRQKGLLAFLALLLYAAGLSSFVLYEKRALLAEVAALRDSYERERLANNEHTTRVRALAALQAGMLELPPDDRRHRLAVLRNAGPDLIAGLPAGGELLRTVERAYAAPTLENVNALHDSLAVLEFELLRDLDRIRRHESGLLNRFHDRSNQAANLALIFGVLGIAVIGFVSGGFLHRMTRDLRTLEAGATGLLAAEQSARGISRNDEVGRLGEVLNEVAGALRERQASEEFNRRRQFHHEKNAAISNLAAGIIHEIGNPLSIISDQTQILAARCRNTPGSQSHVELEEIERQVVRINELVREVTDFAAPDSAEWELLDINQLLATQFNRLRHESPFLDQFCRLQLDRSLPAVPGVGEQLGQVLSSLLMNAVDAVTGMEDRMPEIVLASRNRGEQVEIRIEDNGQGMDEATAGRAFDVFFTTKPEGMGSGLGLSLCRSIIERHGGSIDLQSQPGRGTRVRLLLPREHDGQKPA